MLSAMPGLFCVPSKQVRVKHTPKVPHKKDLIWLQLLTYCSQSFINHIILSESTFFILLFNLKAYFTRVLIITYTFPPEHSPDGQYCVHASGSCPSFVLYWNYHSFEFYLMDWFYSIITPVVGSTHVIMSSRGSIPESFPQKCASKRFGSLCLSAQTCLHHLLQKRTEFFRNQVKTILTFNWNTVCVLGAVVLLSCEALGYIDVKFPFGCL